MGGEPSRRRALMATGAGLAAALTACSSSDAKDKSGAGGSAKNPEAKIEVIGDGSTSDTGPQPHQPTLPPLQPGKAPPQFVVFSWDGGGETDNHMLTRFRNVMREVGGSMTIFLSGLYTLRGKDAKLYKPPRNPVGSSAIPFLGDESVRRTITGVGQAWLEGHEIGTHFNGHFCSGSGSVAKWSSKDWTSEINQAIWMVTHWRTTTGWTDIPSLPFDYTTELIGSRTPCLLGQKALIPAAATFGWRYDSSTGGNQMWPKLFEKTNIWNMPMSLVPFPGHSFQVIAMDYNYMANQSGPQPDPKPTHYEAWKKQAYGALQAGFDRAYKSNRAPLVIGNHFETWNGGIYMDVIEESMRAFAKQPDTYLVSFRQLVDWLDDQDPDLLAELATLAPGVGPEGGWAEFAPPAAG